jgi:Tol biopolymer transport system component
MPDTKQLLRETRDRIAPPPDVHGGLERRRRHQDNVKRAVAAVVAIVVAIVGLGGWFLLEREAAPKPADRPADLGIFAPVAGRIVFVEQERDTGFVQGIWAIDPNGPSDPIEGPSGAGDASSTLVPLDLEEAAPPGFTEITPFGWSSDGTELLFARGERYSQENPFPEAYLYVLHADGSETRLNSDPMVIWEASGAAISADGTRVVFAAWADDLGLYIVDTEGGQPVPLPLPGAEGIVMSPTISPDGTRIAYLDSGRENHVWVMDADGGNAREILADEAIVPGEGLQWSPAGDRIAGVAGSSIYTFAPDGSDLARVIPDGVSPYWSPDGSRIAYTAPCDEQCQSRGDTGGLAVADADGSNVREFGFAASGPWHPGVAATSPEPTPIETPSPTPTTAPAVSDITRVGGEVLRFTGEESQGPGDLVAVDPETGETRVLVEGLEDVNLARWSADGRWIAYETTFGPLWVVGSDQHPRRVTDDYAGGWVWSPTGARLAVVVGNTLSVVDASTGQTTELTSTEWTPVWSPDGTRLVFGERGGSIYSVDVATGERSLLVRLPGNLDSVDEIEWSPDGSRLAIRVDHGAGDLQLFLLNADGSDVRVVVEDAPVSGVDWSPDGTRIAFTESYDAQVRVWVAPVDGSPATLLVSQPSQGEGGDPEWSPDGSQIAFWTEHDEALVIDADGSGDVAPLDALTYESWRGGWFACSLCLGFGPPPF